MQYFTSDLHLGHTNILHLGDGRPFNSIHEHNMAIIERYNAVVEEEDTVWFLGDIIMGDFERNIQLLQRFKGIKKFVVGNHDRLFKGENSHARIARSLPFYEKYFTEIHLNHAETTLPDGTEVTLSHFPYTADHHDKPRWVEFRPVDNGGLLIHGHTHSDSANTSAREYHVGVDAHNYSPVSENTVLDYFHSFR